jgi:uncharacterized protein YgiM (DUF1202 family)
MKFLGLNVTAGIAGAVLLATAGGAFAASLDNDVNVMARPSANSKIVAALKAGDQLSVASQRSSWCQITAPAEGWVPCSDINELNRTNLATPPEAPKGYDYNTDPYLGPNGGIHTVYNGQFQ